MGKSSTSGDKVPVLCRQLPPRPRPAHFRTRNRSARMRSVIAPTRTPSAPRVRQVYDSVTHFYYNNQIVIDV